MKYIFLIISSTLISLSSLGQNYAKIDSIIKKHQQNGFNGNVVYAKYDSIRFSGNYGVTDYEKSLPLNDSSIFELGSNAKQFTAIAIVQLIEKNAIEYSTEITEIIEDFPYEGITVEHLLRHQSGLPSFMQLMSKKKYGTEIVLQVMMTFLMRY